MDRHEVPRTNENKALESIREYLENPPIKIGLEPTPGPIPKEAFQPLYEQVLSEQSIKAMGAPIGRVVQGTLEIDDGKNHEVDVFYGNSSLLDNNYYLGTFTAVPSFTSFGPYRLDFPMAASAKGESLKLVDTLTKNLFKTAKAAYTDMWYKVVSGGVDGSQFVSNVYGPSKELKVEG